MDLSVGILSGGKSSRMGKDKAFLDFQGKSFIESIYTEFSDFPDSLISTTENETQKYKNLGAKIVCDENLEIGPIEGIRQILKNAKNEYTFICAADMPFIKKEIALYLAEFISSDYDCYVISESTDFFPTDSIPADSKTKQTAEKKSQSTENTTRPHPLCAIYSKKIIPQIEAQIKDKNYRLMSLLDAIRTKYVKIEDSRFEKKIIRNVNTPEEYKRLLLPIIFCVSGIKNSGKTTLVEKLILAFKNEGLSVAVIKHDGHDYIMDYEGTDTFRYKKTGAVLSAIFSKTQYSVNCDWEKHSPATVKSPQSQVPQSANQSKLLTPLPDEKKLISYCIDVNADVIIMEGLKNSEYPKVEVVRKEISDSPVCDEKTLICIASDVLQTETTNCPVFDINDIQGIFGAVKRYFGI